MSKPNPTYYAIIPANVRYDENLTSTAKLLFGEITALANTQGFCSASNPYFAKLYGISPRHVSELVTSLVGQGHVRVEIDHAAGNKRKIRLAMPMELNPNSYTEKSEDPYGTKSEHNNTSNNNRGVAPAPSPQVIRIYELYLRYFIITEDNNLAAAMRRYRLTPKRIAAVERRLKDGDMKMIMAAVVGFGKSDWSNGNNDRRWKADLESYICRSYENVEKGARLYEDLKKNPSSEDAWAKL